MQFCDAKPLFKYFEVDECVFSGAHQQNFAGVCLLLVL